MVIFGAGTGLCLLEDKIDEKCEYYEINCITENIKKTRKNGVIYIVFFVVNKKIEYSCVEKSSFRIRKPHLICLATIQKKMR